MKILKFYCRYYFRQKDQSCTVTSDLRIFFAAVLLIPFLFGCSSFLTEYMPGSSNVNDFYSSPAECEIALTGCYSPLSTYAGFSRDLPCAFATGTDEYSCRSGAVLSNPTGLDFIHNMGYSPQNYAYGDEVMLNLYSGINRCNTLLENIDKAQFNSSTDPNQKIRIISETRFLRSVYYMYLSFYFGSVPLVMKSLGEEKIPQSPVQDIFQEIESGLTFAYHNLPTTQSQNSKVNKWAAGAMLLRMYNYLASCKENKIGDMSPNNISGKNYHSFDWVNASAYWSKAKILGDSIYRFSNYKLNDSYHLMFYDSNKGYQYNEFMFTAECDLTSIYSNIATILLAGSGDYPTNGGQNGNTMPPVEFALLYDTLDARYIHNIISIIPTKTTYPNPPKAGSKTKLVYQEEMVAGKAFAIPFAFDTISKRDPNGNTISNLSVDKLRHFVAGQTAGIAWNGNFNFPVMRFADVVLMYAEALYKTGDEVGARTILRDIRNRAAGKDIMLTQRLTDKYKTKAGGDFMKELMQERSRELSGEGIRRIDLVRTATYKSALNAINPRTDIRFTLKFNNVSWKNLQDNYADFKIFFPIPQKQVDLNPVLMQPDGYR
ncbi:MAG: RagB/SusD family nutrient uptake outer membrane protein [Prolixibacteraceae bacterium]